MSIYARRTPKPMLESGAGAQVARMQAVWAYRMPSEVLQRGSYEIMRYKVYLLMEEAKSSFAAMVIHTVLMTCIVGSTITFCLETVPFFEEEGQLWWQAEVLFSRIFSG